MKLPGKRDRQRKASSSASQEAAIPPGAKPLDTSASSAPASPPVRSIAADQEAAEPLGPRLALAMPRLLRSPEGLIAIAFLGAAALFQAIDASLPKATEAPPPVAPPREPATTPDAPLDLDPLLSLEDPVPGEQGPPRLADARLAPPLPDDDSPASGDGARTLAEALALTPRPSLRVCRELNRVALDPDGDASEDTLEWTAECEPALAAFEQATRCQTFGGASVSVAAPTSTTTSAYDLQLLHNLSAASLVLGRMQTRCGAPARGASPAVGLVRLGHGLSRASSPLDAAVGLAVARTGERWIARSLERDRWTRPELEWLHERLTAIATTRRATSPIPAEAAEAAEATPASGVARTDAQEREALDALVALCARKLSTSSELSEGGNQ